MKDHEIAQLVNTLRDIAVKYHSTQQLREHISQAVNLAVMENPCATVFVQMELDALRLRVTGFRNIIRELIETYEEEGDDAALIQGLKEITGDA